MGTQMQRKVAGALAGAAIALLAGQAHAETIKLTLLGVGDIYNFETGKVRGGFARLNAVAKAEKARDANFIYVFDGDMFSPSLLSGLDKGANTVDLTNLVPFDIAVPGNHEFDFGLDNFRTRISEAKYPWAAVNITEADGGPVKGVGGTMVKDVQGVKVALVPVAEDETPVVSSPGDLKFGDTVKSAIEAGKAARAAGADLVVGVVQANHVDDAEIVKSHVFDVVLSGDDHDFVASYDGITAYVETSTEANYLTPVDLTINVSTDGGQRTVTWSPDFRFIDTQSVTPDPETQALVDQYKSKLDAQLSQPVGVTQGPLDSRRNVVRGEESAIGDLIADAIRGANGADIAITNGGGIRGDKQYPAGATLTRKDVFTELPFGNVTVVTEVTGKAVWDALENGFSQVEQGAGRFPQVSGLVVTADLKQPPGHRVVSVMVGDKPLDPAATYKVATNDFMLKGGDGYTALATGKVLIGPLNGSIMATDVMNYIEATKTVDAKVEGRIILK
ncbi:MAG TPA: bifunctional UDP-sugar hydrolase/5'-nucleotidase [Devosiaceae bacterium]|nr:bifunctional UDP-sugar hydrolase/5'-nucleotidase [Devosiaceae bacterium]